MTDTAPVRDDSVPSAKLLMTLGGAGAVAGLAIVAVFGWTEPTIRAYKAEVVRLAVQEVLDEPERFDTLYVIDDILTLARPEGSRPEEFERVYAGYRGEELVGYAIASGEPGFQDIVRLIFGYDRAAGNILGMRVLESKETPGLGDKIEKDQAFVTQFVGALAPLVGVTPRSAKGDPHEIDMITGATISSRTVIRIINNAIDRLDPLLAEYEEWSGP
jgi:electron transport complex protein RnfG